LNLINKDRTQGELTKIWDQY